MTKNIMKNASRFAYVLALVGLLFIGVPRMVAQQDAPPPGADADDNFNPPPCDFNNQFYADNGMDVTQLVGRFGDNNGTTRLTGPPARGNHKNYVADSTCVQRDPTRRNFRILATTGGNADDGNSPYTCASTDPNSLPHSPQCANQSTFEPETFEFISILAFVNQQAAFAQGPYDRNVGFINGGLQGVQHNPGEDISYGANVNVDGTVIPEAPGQTLRGFAMQDIVGNFEAYGTISQFTNSLDCGANNNGSGAPFTSANCTPVPGTFAPGPCSIGMLQHQNPGATVLTQPCFQVADTTDSSGNPVSDVATPKLRQDWRFATNRNAMDGSDGNNPFATSPVSAPFGYFCDDLLGMWIITYFWFTQPPNTQVQPCKDNFAAIGAKNGFNNDGTPIILTAFELNFQIEGAGCGAEGQEDGATDGGAGWLICPALPDPRAGAIATDAFIDQVFMSNGKPQNFNLTLNFVSLQLFGVFFNELISGSSQQSQAQTQANTVTSTN